jgi:hypothetical protein
MEYVRAATENRTPTVKFVIHRSAIELLQLDYKGEIVPLLN